MGIGEATARALAKAGANLILLSRSEVHPTLTDTSLIWSALTPKQDKLAKLTAELNSQYPQSKAIYRTADVGNYEEVDAAVESSVEEIGGIDILINNVQQYYPSAHLGTKLMFLGGSCDWRPEGIP